MLLGLACARQDLFVRYFEGLFKPLVHPRTPGSRRCSPWRRGGPAQSREGTHWSPGVAALGVAKSVSAAWRFA